MTEPAVWAHNLAVSLILLVGQACVRRFLQAVIVRDAVRRKGIGAD
jgi:hypothetical protein